MHVINVTSLIGLLVVGLISCQDQSHSSKPLSVDSIQTTMQQPDTIAAPVSVETKHWLFDTLTIDGNYFDRQRKLRTPVPVSERQHNPLFAFFAARERTLADLQFYVFDTLITHPEHPAVLIATATENEQTIWLAQIQPNQKKPVATVVYYEDFVEYLNRTDSKATPTELRISQLDFDEQDRTKTTATTLKVDSLTGLILIP